VRGMIWQRMRACRRRTRVRTSSWLLAALAPIAISTPSAAPGQHQESVPGRRAALAADCAEIFDRNERLDCYDGIFVRRIMAPLESGSAAAPRNDTHATTTSDVNRTKTVGPSEATLPEPPGTDMPGRIESTVTAVYRDSQRKMIVALANDQIWIQSSPRELPIRTGDRVVVAKTLMGGHMLRTAEGVSTRVNKIR